MNILIASYYYKPHIGGVENSIFHLSAAFVRKGHHVTIVCSDADVSKKKRLEPKTFINGIEVYRFRRFIPFVSFLSFFAPIVDIMRVKKCIQNLDQVRSYDLLITRNHVLGLGAKKAGIKKSYFLIPSMVKDLDTLSFKSFSKRNFKSIILLYYVNWILNPMNQFLQKQYLKKVDKVLVFSQNLKKQIFNYIPSARDKIVVVPPGVELSHKPYTRGKTTRKPFVFLIIGRLIHVKRVDMAIQAMASLGIQGCVLKIVGEGPVRESLKELTLNLGLNETIEFYDFTDDVASFYEDAHCFLMTSEFETFGQTIIEAMSFGLPVIAFSNDGVKVRTSSDEILVHRENGLLCKFSVTDLASSMLEIMKMQQKDFDRIAYNNVLKVTSKYNWDRYVDDFLTLL